MVAHRTPGDDSLQCLSDLRHQLTLFGSYQMRDFSAHEFSSTGSSLCVAIFIIAASAGVAELLRLHTLLRPAVERASKKVLFQVGSNNHVPDDEFDWEIRPPTGKPVSYSALIVPLLSLGLLVSTEVNSVRKASAINTG
jgi:hypothetical protein